MIVLCVSGNRDDSVSFARKHYLASILRADTAAGQEQVKLALLRESGASKYGLAKCDQLFWQMTLVVTLGRRQSSATTLFGSFDLKEGRIARAKR